MHFHMHETAYGGYALL